VKRQASWPRRIEETGESQPKLWQPGGEKRGGGVAAWRQRRLPSWRGVARRIGVGVIVAKMWRKPKAAENRSSQLIWRHEMAWRQRSQPAGGQWRGLSAINRQRHHGWQSIPMARRNK